MIRIRNLSGTEIREPFVREVVKAVLEGEGKSGFDLSLVFVEKGEMARINEESGKKEGATDVLAFDLREKRIPGSMLGEIFVSPEVVEKRSEEEPAKALARTLIHGLLHLSDYDHTGGKQEAQRMRKREDYYLAKTF